MEWPLISNLVHLGAFAGSAAHGGSSGSDPRAVEVTTIESIDREAGEADNGFYYLAMHGNIIYVSDYRNNVILSNHTGEQVVTLTATMINITITNLF